MDELLATLLGGHGLTVQIISFVGLLRLLIKPITEAVLAYVAWTPSEKDDSLVNKVIKSPTYTKIMFILDWIASIKVKK